MEEESDLISDMTDEKFQCHNCGKEITKFSEMFIDGFLWEIFAYLFCTVECRDAYIDSK